MLRFTMTTLGCKVNQYDSAALAATLAAAGFVRAEKQSPAPDLVVINTCCITTVAMRKSRQAVRRAVRTAPTAAVLVTGCYSDYDADRLRALLIDLGLRERQILIAGHHDDLANRLRQWAAQLRASEASSETASLKPDASRPMRDNAIMRDDGYMRADKASRDPAASNASTIKTRRQRAVKRKSPGTRGLTTLEQFAGHQRAFVKVQDGCDAFCSYCIVPYTRCSVWSRDPEDVETECHRLVTAGHKEIVLCGVFLGAYGRETAIRRRWGDTPAPLPVLLRRIAAIPGLWRVRLSSLEPGDVTDELLAVYAEYPTVAPHLHLPLQSGSPHILKKMNRQYTPNEFCRTVDHLREIVDRPAVTTDIIVGFPGETEDDFAETLAVAQHAGFSKIHAFPFSAIPGTAAWTHRNECPEPAVVRRRMETLAALERELASNYRKQFIGETVEALVEKISSKRGGPCEALTDRYLNVSFPAPAGRAKHLKGQVVTLNIDGLTPDGLQGTIIT